MAATAQYHENPCWLIFLCEVLLTEVCFKISKVLIRFCLLVACRLSENKCKILDLNFIQHYQWIIPVLWDSGERLVCAEGLVLSVVWARNHCCAVERCSGSLWARTTASSTALQWLQSARTEWGYLVCVATFLQASAKHKQSLERVPKQEEGYQSYPTPLLHADGRAVLVIVITSGRERRNLLLGWRDEKKLLPLLSDWLRRVKKTVELWNNLACKTPLRW